MRRSSTFALAAISVLVGCKSETKTLPPPPPPPPGQVELTLTCVDGGGLNYSLFPTSVTLPDSMAPFKWHNSHTSNVDGVIAAKDTTYPFGKLKFTAPHSGNGMVVAKPIRGTPAGRYKYSVTVICPAGGANMDTTVIDPDMIIPWKISAM
jgi:hypothetical protein